MSRFKMTRLVGAAAVMLALSGASVAAKSVQITVTNNQASGGLSLTPFFTAFHNGNFNTFDPGSNASSYVELLAETGDPSGALSAASAAGATAGVAAAPGGFPGAPVLEPGEAATLTLNVNPANGQYLSFLSMVIPSNDLFVGNSNPTAYQIFDAAGNFTGISDIILTASNVYDAGTEANTNQGAAFNTAGGIATDTSNPIALANDLSFLLGQGTPIGPVTNIGASLATISVTLVPIPPALSMSLAGLALLGWTARRRKIATA